MVNYLVKIVSVEFKAEQLACTGGLVCSFKESLNSRPPRLNLIHIKIDDTIIIGLESVSEHIFCSL